MLGRPTIAWGLAQGNPFIGDKPTPRRPEPRPSAPERSGLADKWLISGHTSRRYARRRATRGCFGDATVLEQFRHMFAADRHA